MGKMNKRYDIQITIDYRKDSNGNIHSITRRVKINGTKVYNDTMLATLYYKDRSALRAFELWLADASLGHKFQRCKNRASYGRDFLRFIQQVWRKLFTKQVDLKS